MSRKDIIKDKLAALKRRRDGGVTEEELIDDLAREMRIDLAEEKRKKAKELIDSQTKPRSTDPSGQLKLPGIDGEYDYEPDRLIRNDEGGIVEQSKASPVYKQAEASRASDHAARAMYLSKIKTEESLQFSRWALEQANKSRPFRELTWHNFISETGIWKKG
jgi:hypothetical protein